MGTTTSPARRNLFAAVIAILVLALVPAALAGKGGNGNGKSVGNGNATSNSSLALELVADANGDGAPSWGDTVRFTVNNPPSNPNVELLCSQNDTVVYAAQTGYFATTWPQTGEMVLKSQAWSGGATSCNARLYVFNGTSVSTLATTSFSAT